MTEKSKTILTPGMVLRRHDGDLDEDVYNLARDILNALPKDYLTSGKAPSSIAASAVYVASIEVGVKLGQDEIGEMFDVSDVTVRVRYQEILERL